MADGNGVVVGGGAGDVELNSRGDGGRGSRDPGAESGVAGSSSTVNPRGGSDPQDLEAQADPQNVDDNIAHREIRNLLLIKDNREHQAALTEWDRKELYLSSKVDRKEKRSADLTNHIFNIVGFFSVFQGVVLTAVSQLKSSNNPLCGMVWVPALLSVLAAVVAIIAVWIKFSTLQELEVSIFSDKIAQREVAGRVTRLRAEGGNFNFIKHAAQGRIKKSSSWVSVSRICVILSLVIFTGLIILSYVVILCNKLAVSKWNKHLLSST